MSNFIDTARNNMYAANNRTEQLENQYFPKGLGAQQVPQPQQAQPRVDPMANINAQRQPAPNYQAPSGTDMDGYIGFLKQADVAKDWMSANQPVPKSVRRSIDRTQNSFQGDYPAMKNADLQNRSADYLSSFGYRR